MATTYFDPTDTNDLALLPLRLRSADDLAITAVMVEKDIINQYVTVINPLLRGWYPSPYRPAVQAAPNSNRWIFLKGYTLDPNDPACDPDLKVAMKYTVALVLRWRLAQARENPLAAADSASDGSHKHTTFRANTLDNPFPPSWDRYLADFGNREPY